MTTKEDEHANLRNQIMKYCDPDSEYYDAGKCSELSMKMNELLVEVSENLELFSKIRSWVNDTGLKIRGSDGELKGVDLTRLIDNIHLELSKLEAGEIIKIESLAGGRKLIQRCEGCGKPRISRVTGIAQLMFVPSHTETHA